MHDTATLGFSEKSSNVTDPVKVGEARVKNHRDDNRNSVTEVFSGPTYSCF